ncbi:3-phenylpropionate/cinnamic acid dioxygenase ferredoxin--NAD(+) reductase subunit [Moraxella sp. ZY210820]|uniref:3-phenylpropionate/cinnamic acid dioxygenase ferredoxin--NAD(+) reductase subunit n=1 Tax=unclassified Moraxella TaxID=2685852 RepID=UPI00272F06B1|nr:3-phenylpropionate/cinnamic acid dioxygenase ferredoxin--NAD(+) reductase subunit [Moraxella sp. ZY210820]WLF83973.1 FAD-dependent oxidoreductase [Moraxella sp. ZY210820]
MSESIVIVGAGQAGASAIIALRANQYQGKIVLVGDENHLPYERPPLSKDAILKPDETKIEILSQQKLDEFNVQFIRHQAVTALFPSEHRIQLENGEMLHYSKLLLATGGSVRRLPMLDALEKHVYTLRNVEDAQALIPIFQEGKKILIVGGGVIGLELASSARSKNCQVTVLEQGTTVMGRSSPAILSEFLLEQHRKQGVDIRLLTQISQAELCDGQVVLTLTDGEQLTGDAVIYGIGIIPNVQLAQNAGLDVDFAIKINQFGQTSDPDIYAAGDVTIQQQADGSYRRVETWENANNQAALFAAHALGLDIPSFNPAWFWTDQYNINIQFVGDMSAQQWYIRGEINHEQPNFILFGVDDGTIVAGITVNQAKDMRHLKKMVAQKRVFELDKLLDLSVDLKKV